MRLAFFYVLSVLVMLVGYMVVSVIKGCVQKSKQESVSMVEKLPNGSSEKGVHDAKKDEMEKEKEKGPLVAQVDEAEAEKAEGKIEITYFRDRRVKFCFGKELFTGSVFWVPCSKKLDKYINVEIK